MPACLCVRAGPLEQPPCCAPLYLTPITLASSVFSFDSCIRRHCSEPELKTEAVTGTSSGLNSDMAEAFRKLASILSGARQLCAYCTAAVALLDG